MPVRCKLYIISESPVEISTKLGTHTTYNLGMYSAGKIKLSITTDSRRMHIIHIMRKRSILILNAYFSRFPIESHVICPSVFCGVSS